MNFFRKLTCIFLISLLSLSICACSKSEKAQNVDDLILAIGEVSYEHFDPDALVVAQDAYAELSDEEKETVENYELLTQARDKAFEMIMETEAEAFTAGELENAYNGAIGFVGYGFHLTDEQLADLQGIVTTIEDLCFAGTFVAMPDTLIPDRPPRDVVARTLSWLNSTNMSPYFMYKYGDEGTVVWRQYLQYLAGIYELIDSGSFSYSGSDTEYYKFLDRNNNTIYVSCETTNSWRSGSESTITVELTGIDTSRLDLSKQETATHRDIDNILIRTDLSSIS